MSDLKAPTRPVHLPSDIEAPVSVGYDQDVLAWANRQAQLIRSGQFHLLDIEHVADEIEDVGKSEKRELESRMALVLAHLLKWKFQPDRRGASWERTLLEQRKRVASKLKEVPSLRPLLRDQEWFSNVWSDGVTLAIRETAIDFFPQDCPWTAEQVIDRGFYPD